jgi:hypothetical protein
MFQSKRSSSGENYAKYRRQVNVFETSKFPAFETFSQQWIMLNENALTVTHCISKTSEPHQILLWRFKISPAAVWYKCPIAQID